MEQIVDQVDSEDELLERKALVEKVIERLMYHVSLFFQYYVFDVRFFLFFCYFSQDQVIIPLSGTGLRRPNEDSQDIDDDPLLVVHPNYVVDS